MIAVRDLIVRKPYADWIVEGRKIWEIRRSRTQVRREVLIISGGKAIEKADLVEVVGPFTLEKLAEHSDKHLVDYEFLKDYSRGKPLHTWAFLKAEKFENPIEVKLKRGVQVWAKVDLEREEDEI